MKPVTSACLAIALAGSVASGSAWARGGGFGGGHYGGGWGGGHYGGGWGYGHGGHYGGGYYGGIGIYGLGYYGWPYYSPYYAYPPAVVTVPASPPVYIEQGGGQPDPQGQYWYYCAGSQAYYPYVKDCPGGWQQVAPQPPPPPQ
jgi:hypothetical protein